MQSLAALIGTPPPPTYPLRIGARGSPLSLAQTGWLRARLGEALGVAPGDLERDLPILPIVTTGDRIQDRTLAEAGGKGLFTKELDEALLDGRIDCAIHSMKDVPTFLPPGISLLASPVREDPRDALMTLDGRGLDALADGAHVGTASLRRAAQLRHARPDLRISPLRGNVGTRLERLREGRFDATVLARAGLSRLGLDSEPHALLDPVAMPPAIAQGALGVTGREGDFVVAAAFARLACRPTAIAVAAERAFLTALDGSCRTAIGGHAWIEGTLLRFVGEALSEDGAIRWRREAVLEPADREEAEALGERLGREIREEAGDGLARDTAD